MRIINNHRGDTFQLWKMSFLPYIYHTICSFADAEHLPFAPASFERVTCRIAPHHFTNVAHAVQEIARVLKPGGLFLLIDSCAPANAELDTFANIVEKWRDASHSRSYSVKEWYAFFAEADLRVEEQELFRKTHSYDD